MFSFQLILQQLLCIRLKKKEKTLNDDLQMNGSMALEALLQVSLNEKTGTLAYPFSFLVQGKNMSHVLKLVISASLK